MDTKGITTCGIADSAAAYRCITEEQCDDCFMVDHLKECSGCEHYDHPVAQTSNTCECNGTGYITIPDRTGEDYEAVECAAHHPAYQK